MSSISNATANAQQYLQTAQAGPKTDGTTPNTATAGLNTQQSTIAPSTKPLESLSFKNADGTYGPKHTLRPPASVVTSATESSDAVAVNVKV